ncbi:SWIM zinc finger family protein [Candidatus Poribacteria bacterium]|nr:SWIM zinc finger family protein [Candidatus Poribacteria bacterium]
MTISKQLTKIAEKSFRRWEVPSDSIRDFHWLVSQGEKWACDCPSFRYRGETCKHILRVQDCLKVKEINA